MESEEEIVVGSEEILEVRSEEEEILEVESEEMEMEVGAEAGDAENRCPIFKYRKLNTEQHWEMIHIISSFTSSAIPYRLNSTLSSLKIDSKKTPVEFFGVPINDKTLLEAILILFWELVNDS
ncbi:hypothetical protein OS493_033118 [Desmophyllum pertusum]|uniref:Uncharacterized protein n=1 Tax=Desmophyllum pertusum TaxID=174260 RepID=A0A9W9YVP1_9CNID|nr:hypothetical protein OS493_033118 [Desmophyllum pertusum]